MTLNAVSYGEFSMALHEHFGDKRSPVEVSIEVSRRCPLDCQHCYNNLPMGDLAARHRELTKDEYEKILDELADMGVIWLLFTGGEIFARKDFLEIYTYAKQKGFLITLFTNGILINEKIADYLREFPPFAIEITLYGRTKETYEALTQIPGSYDRCLRGIRLLMDRGLPLKLKTVGTKTNCHEVIAMKEFTEHELGLEFKFDSLLNPRIDCSQAPLAVRLSPEEVVELENGDPESPVDFLCEVAHLRAMALGFEVPEHGDCEFCHDVERREALVESADRIAAREIDPNVWSAPRSLLPVLNNPVAGAGCGGCGTVH